MAMAESMDVGKAGWIVENAKALENSLLNGDNILIPNGFFYYGFKIIESDLLVDRILKKRCRSKKRRIVKKWNKNPKNWGSKPSELIYRMSGNILVAHPVVVAKIKEVIK